MYKRQIRVHAQAAARQVKEEGLPNDLIHRICSDPSFGLKEEDLAKTLDPSQYTGRSAQQTQSFVDGVVRPILSQHRDEMCDGAELTV